jgi:inward rectifier potassium channel
MSQKPPASEPTAKIRPLSLAKAPLNKKHAIIKGQDSGRFTDFYHGVLTATWPVFVLQLAALFVGVNILFALLYMFDRGGISHARPGNFTDAFFFSVQTLGAGGGEMAPQSLYANILVAAESFIGILTIALFAGIMFARFSRPLSRVLFSKVAVVAPFDGVPTLMFRAANQRGNSILDAAVTVSLARQYVTREGVEMRRFQELKLVRSNNPLFALSWTVMHPIDEASPLFGLTTARLAEQDIEIIIMLSGMDETISDHIYARHAYWNDEILWQRRFVDVISIAPTGHRVVDLTHFHDTLEINETVR